MTSDGSSVLLLFNMLDPHVTLQHIFYDISLKCKGDRLDCGRYDSSVLLISLSSCDTLNSFTYKL